MGRHRSSPPPRARGRRAAESFRSQKPDQRKFFEPSPQGDSPRAYRWQSAVGEPLPAIRRIREKASRQAVRAAARRSAGPGERAAVAARRRSFRVLEGGQ